MLLLLLLLQQQLQRVCLGVLLKLLLLSLVVIPRQGCLPLHGLVLSSQQLLLLHLQGLECTRHLQLQATMMMLLAEHHARESP
jgi:hypothetical protein